MATSLPAPVQPVSTTGAGMVPTTPATATPAGPSFADYMAMAARPMDTALAAGQQAQDQLKQGDVLKGLGSAVRAGALGVGGAVLSPLAVAGGAIYKGADALGRGMDSAAQGLFNLPASTDPYGVKAAAAQTATQPAVAGQAAAGAAQPAAQPAQAQASNEPQYTPAQQKAIMAFHGLALAQLPGMMNYYQSMQKQAPMEQLGELYGHAGDADKLAVKAGTMTQQSALEAAIQRNLIMSRLGGGMIMAPQATYGAGMQ